MKAILPGLLKRILMQKTPSDQTITDQSKGDPTRNDPLKADPKGDQPPSPAPAKRSNDTRKLMSNTFLWGILIGCSGVIGYPLTMKGSVPGLLFLGLLIAFASFISGFFTGTLFGMPKRNQDEKGNYILNNSLVEISDWLTKIIVGLGLVNLLKIPGYLQSIGFYIRGSLNQSGVAIDIYSICVILFFGVFGMYLGYNYMRLVLSELYKESDDIMLKEKLEKAEKKAQEENIKARKVINEYNKTDQQINNVRENIAKSAADNKRTAGTKKIEEVIDALVKEAELRTSKGLLRKDDDPQKGLWGRVSETNFRKLNASVNDLHVGLYQVNLEVTSTDKDKHPLKDGEIVLFALHNTFGDPPIRLVKVENGAARLSLISYGSFTVGVFADEGKTELELDLAELPNVSDYFKKN